MSTAPSPSEGPHRHPWWFVPTLYVLEGLPYFVVNEVAVILMKRLDVDNVAIAWWTSLLAWPWTLKMLWSPFVEVASTRRRWLLAMEGVLVATTAALAVAIASPSWFAPTLVVLGLMAFASATHDVAVDGFYMLALDGKQQAFFSGIRSTAYRLARIFVAGFVVWFAGTLEVAATGVPSPLAGVDRAFAGLVADPIRRPWVVAFGLVAAVQAVLWLYNALMTPAVAADRPGDASADRPSLTQAFTAFFRQPGIGWVLAFILTYRFPEQMLVKMAGPFLLDPIAKGGLAVATADVGLVQGTLGVVHLVAGGILGGVAIARWGLWRCLWPMVAAMHLPNLLYLAAALTQPGLGLVSVVVSVEQFGYGFGFSAYTVFLLKAAGRTSSPTSSYAVATGIMAFGAFLAGSLSGLLQTALGYPAFFAVVCALSLPAIVPLFYVAKAARVPE